MDNITIKIGNVNSRIFGFLPVNVMDELYDKLAFQKKNIEFSAKVIEGKWDGYRRLFDKYKKTFPTGLLSLVYNILKKHNYKIELDDQRVKPQPNRSWNLILPESIPTLYDFQQEAVHIAKKSSRGIFSIATGGGKTLTFAAIISEVKTAPVIIYVPSLLLLYQTKEEIEKFVRNESGVNIEVGVVGDGKCDIKDITVMTIQTAITAFDMEYDKNKDTVRYLTPEQIQKKNEQLLRKQKTNNEDPDSTEDLSFVVTRKEILKDLINNAKVIICDECFKGGQSTYVLMPNGKYESLSKLVNMKYNGEVMSWNEKQGKMEPKKIISHIKKKRLFPMVQIDIWKKGAITCTNNHLILTNNGWKMAKDIKERDLIITPDMNHKNSCYALPDVVKQVVLGSFLGCGNLQKAYKTILGARLSITHFLEQKEYLEYKMSFFDKIGGATFIYTKTKLSNQLQIRAKTKSFAEIYDISMMSKKEIISKLDILGLAIWYLDNGIFDRKKNVGYIDIRNLKYEECLKLVEKMKEFNINVKIDLNKGGYTLYINKKNMEAFSRLIYQYTPECMEYKLPSIQYNNQKFDLSKIQHLNYKYCVVKNVSKVDKFDEDVYCLEVEDNHNFIIQSGVVHNCHRASSAIYQEVLKQSPLAYYRWAMSATAIREDNTEMLIQAIFGKILMHVPCSELIRRPDVKIIRPYIFMIDTPNYQNKNYQTYAQIRKNCIVESQQRNQLIANVAQYMQKYGPTLLLVGIIEHGKKLEKMIPGSVFISGKTSKNKKQQALNDLMSGELKILIASPIIDEGLNLPGLKVLILCDGGKAATKLYQRIGRVVRETPGKEYALVVDFKDKNDILEKHANRREKLYLLEDEWVLTHISADKIESIKG